MNPTTSIASPADFLRLFLRYPLRWLLPTIAVAAAGVGYALWRPDSWEASQALVVRNDVNGNLEEAGKFRHSDELKALLDTMLEISKTHSVLHDTLVAVGPPFARTATAPWPTEQEVADFGDAVKLVPPKGAEYGKTEMFYLKIRDRDRARALQLTDVVCSQLDRRFSQLRNQKAGSMVDELVEGVQLASADLTETTNKLKELEAKVGSDLSELRNLHQAGGGGESDLRRRSLELENELRQATIIEANRSMLLKSLEGAQADQGRLRAIPNGLLDSQPTLKKLIEGLIDAQMRTAQLMGSMSDKHPLVQAARSSEQEINDQLRVALATAVRGLKIDKELAHDRVASLQEMLGDSRGRLEKLASLRAEYTNLITQNDERSKYSNELQRKLVEARTAQASTDKTSLLSRVDVPETGPKPVGPGRTTLMAAGVAGGLVVGVGLLLLTVPTGPSPAPAQAKLAAREPAPAAKSGKRLSLKQALARISHPAA